MKRTLPFLFGFLCFPPAFTYAQAGRNFDAVQVETKQVQGNIWMTLKQVQAAKPTWDYEPLYGATTGLAATDSFIEDLYNSLTAKK